MHLWRKWWRWISKSEMIMYFLDLFMECLDLRWGEYFLKWRVRSELFICSKEVAQTYNVWISIRRFVAKKAHTYVGWLQKKCVWNVRIVLKYVQMYTKVCLCESTYIHRFSEVKARMESRVLLKYVERNVWSVLMFYCYLSMMYSYRSGLFECWLCC